MRPRELFGVAVRIMGLWYWSQAAYWFYWAAMKSSSLNLGNPTIPAREDFCYAILYTFLGLFLIAGARFFVWLGYGDAPKTSPDAADG